MDLCRIEPEDLKKWDVLNPCQESFLSDVRLVCFSSPSGELANWALVVTASDKVYTVGDIPAWALYRKTEGVSEPLEITELSGRGVVGFACGAEHCLALTGSGGVMSWGNNSNGQLGLGSKESSKNPFVVHNLPRITSVACGSYFCLALTKHEVYAWGNNQCGQSGSLLGGYVLRPQRVELSTGVTPISVACGKDHTAAVGSDGRIYCWGMNNLGQLGRGIKDKFSDPRPASLVYAASQVCCAGESTVALTLDGQVWAWGNIFGSKQGEYSIISPKLLNGLERVTNITSMWRKCSFIAQTKSIFLVYGNLNGKFVPELKSSSSLAGALDNGPTPTLMVRGRSGGPLAEAGSASLVNHCGELNKPVAQKLTLVAQQLTQAAQQLALLAQTAYLVENPGGPITDPGDLSSELSDNA